MSNDCTKWKDQILDAALTGIAAVSLAEHLSNCETCTETFAALRAKRNRLDALLPRVAQGAEPPPDFRARVLAAAEAAGEAKRGSRWRHWQRVTAMAAIVATLVVCLILYRRALQPSPDTDLAAAQKLAEWRAPSDVLLETPGQEILRTTPRLGESFLQIPANENGEE